MPEQSAAKVPHNNTIPSSAIWTFGLAMLAALLALPFLIFKVMALTQNQAQGMSLAGISGIPLPAGELRCTVRETRDKGKLAARYELTASELAKVREAMVPGAPTPALFTSLQNLSPNETGWQPAPASPGPWRIGAGNASGHTWSAMLDEKASTLWIYAERRDATVH